MLSPFEAKHRIQRTLLELVADKEMSDDFDDLLTAEAIPRVPPALEFEETILLLIDVEEQLRVFFPNCVLRLEVFEVLDQPGAVKTAVVEIGKQARHPASAEKAAGGRGLARMAGHYLFDTET